MERRENDGCPVLKLVPCCPNTGCIQLTVTVWAAVRRQFHLMRTVNVQEKGFDTAPVLLRTTQASALTHGSNISDMTSC